MSMRYQFLSQTKKDFGFLEALGYRIKSEYEGTYSSFKDGFDISYASNDLTARIAYYDMELEIVFQKGKILAPYLFLDVNLFSNASGLSGIMFAHDKLSPVIHDSAKDIQTNYESVLIGDVTIWKKIEKLVMAPKEKKSYIP
jgi:hypothetical protein